MSTESDQRHLLRCAVRGDQAALEQLLLAHYDQLHRFLARKLPTSLQPKVDVEGVLQQTYIEAFRDFGKFQPASSKALKSWLTRIAEHRLLDAIKAARRKKRGGGHRRQPPVDRADASSAAELLDVISDGSHTPSQKVARAEGVKALHVQLAGLPEEYRRLVRLRHLEGKSLNEISQLTGQSVDQIRGLLYRARKRLRDGMGRSSLYFSKG